MKRLITLTLTLILIGFIANVNAQIFNVGIKSSFSSTWIRNKNIPNTQPFDSKNNYKASFGNSVGICGGISYPTLIDNFIANYGVNIEVQYSNCNQNFLRTALRKEELYIMDYTANLYLFNIPVLFKATTRKGIYLEAGPQLSILVDANGTSGNYTLQSRYVDRDITSEFQKYNFDAVAGLGYSFTKIEYLTLSGGIRLNYGMTDVTKPQKGYITDYSPSRMISCGINIELQYRIESYEDAKHHRLLQFIFHHNMIKQGKNQPSDSND